MALQLWERLKEAITVYTGRSRDFEGQMQPLPPPGLVGEITEEELQFYDGSDPKKALIMAIKGQIFDVSRSRHYALNLFGYFGKPDEMEDGHFIGGKWEDLDINILVKIFQSFNIFELTSGIAHVCSTWRLACCDPLLWKTLDLTMLKSNFIKIPLEPYVYVESQSDKTLTRVLKIGLSLSRGNIITLIFHFDLYLSDDQLAYTAERCPRLKRLVLPAWNRIKKSGICKAIPMWKDLESLTMPRIANPPYLMEEIAKNCKNFSELKIMGSCDIFFASTLAAFLPKLKVLSLRCSMLFKDTLILILDCLEHLEVLNISHCLLIEAHPPPAVRKIIKELDESILKKASRLREFLTCMEDSCIMCQRMKNDEGLIRWYKYEEGLWKTDELKSLAL